MAVLLNLTSSKSHVQITHARPSIPRRSALKMKSLRDFDFIDNSEYRFVDAALVNMSILFIINNNTNYKII